MGRFASLLSYEPLPAEEQHRLGRLIKDLRESEDPSDVATVRSAVASLLATSLRMIFWLARKYGDGPVACSLDDLVSEGYDRLLQFGDQWDCDRGRFTTYASLLLRNRFARMAGLLKDTKAGQRWRKRVSLDSDLHFAVVSDPEPVEIPDHSVLTPRQREVVERRFGLGRTEQTLREIGADLGVTHQGIDKAEKSAMARLRSLVPDAPSQPPIEAVGERIARADRRLGPEASSRTIARAAGCSATTVVVSETWKERRG